MKTKFVSARRVLLSAFFAMALTVVPATGLLAQAAADPSADISGLNMSPGADGRELGFAWFSKTQAQKPMVQVAAAADMTGTGFPAAKAEIFTGTSIKVTATAFNSDDKTMSLDVWADKVKVTGLVDSMDYIYRVGDGKAWSPVYGFSTRSQKSFGFLVVGDPQLGAKSTGPKTLESDTAGWRVTLSKATAAFPDASFLVCLGDEVNDYNKIDTQDAEYAAFFSPDQLRSLPMATVNGNHDFQMGEYYGYHYNQPNLSTQYGVSYGNDGDYWFIYGNVLFLMLNSNTESVATHDIFIRDAVAKNPGAKWRIACFHHSVFSEADHFADPDVIDRRTNYPPVFERYKIDVVLSGHDHSYTRTLPILDGKPVDGVDASADSISNPKGVVYFTLNSGSGSKFYDWKDATPEVFSAARWQGKVPSFSYVDISGNRLTVSTMRTDDMSIVDSYSIIKD
jgi:3',5'-cyclic AMP phosphodiesterase CpdA